MDDKIQDAQVKMSGGFWAWLDNFWYHYKWHSLIALFLVVVVTVCSVQMCGKKSYDVYVLYAGDFSVSRATDDGTDPLYPQMLQALDAFAEDRDGNGEPTPSLNTLYVLTNEEIEAENKRREELELATGVKYDRVNAGYVKDNLAVLQSNVRTGDYYIFVLSPSMYRLVRTTADGTEVFAPLGAYVEGTDAELYAADAVLLSSTALADAAGFCDMPEGTVLCLRALSEVSAKRGRDRELFAASESTLRRLLG